MILAAGAAAVSSCKTAKSEFAPLASSVQVDKAEVTLAATGATAKIKVTSDGDWIAVTPEWAKIEPKSGKSGDTEVTITAKDNVDGWNELNGPRKATLYIFGNGEEAGSAQVLLVQNGEAGLNSERTYKKVTSADDFEAGKSYLIVFDPDGNGALKTCIPMSIKPDGGSYSYMSAIDAEESEEGTIITPNGSNGFTFVAKGSGYAIQQSDANFIYQGGTYANFYTSASLEKGDVWKMEFLENGTVKLTNRTNGGDENDDNDKVLHWSLSYGNVEARSAAEEPYPYLYKDSAAPTDEVLLADDVTVVPSATSATIAVTANKAWTVRNHDEWIKSFAKNEAGDAVEVTFDANTSTEEARVATFTIIGESTNVVVTLTQGKVASTVAEISAAIKSTSSSNPSPYEAVLKGAAVTYVSGGNVFIEDESGAILLYLSESGLKAGDVITGKVSGTGYLYRNLPEITSLGEEYEKTDGEAPKPTEMTLDALLKDYNKNLSRYIIVKGVTVTKGVNGKSSGEISQGEGDDAKKIIARGQANSVVLEEGAVGDLICFPCIYNSDKQLSVFETAHFTAAAAE